MVVLAPKKLDDKGRCCGRKPLVYKRPIHRLFCCRCDAQFNPTDGKQVENWAYLAIEGGFTPRYPDQDYWRGETA